MKEELRKKYLIIREKIKNKENKDNLIFEKVISHPKVMNASVILIYVSKDSEVDTLNLIKYFLKKKKVAVPKIENNTMNFYYIHSLNDLEKGYFKILEPISKEKVTNFINAVCITPGICFSPKGYRIGYGKGFYDKFFYQNKIYALGLCYKECLIDIPFLDKYDYKVDNIITD